MQTIYLNGNFVSQDEAKISVFDRGFLFGDSIYEVIPVFRNNFVGINQHLERLNQSLTAIKIEPPLKIEEWHLILRELLQLNTYKEDDLTIYLQVTRGAPLNRSHAIPTQVKPTVLAMCYPTPKKPFNEVAKGFSAITETDKRRTDCFIKSTCLLPNVLSYQHALDQSACEAILIRDGYALEGTSSNLFIVKNNTVITPPLSPNILSGVTRDIILQLCDANNIPTQESPIKKEELYQADEVWVSGSTKEICPITSIDNQTIGQGQPGPMWQRLTRLYDQYKQVGKFTAASKNDSSTLSG